MDTEPLAVATGLNYSQPRDAVRDSGRRFILRVDLTRLGSRCTQCSMKAQGLAGCLAANRRCEIQLPPRQVATPRPWFLQPPRIRVDRERKLRSWFRPLQRLLHSAYLLLSLLLQSSLPQNTIQCARWNIDARFFPETVTAPGLFGCLSCRWLPFVLAKYQPSSSRSLRTSLTFISR